MEARRESAADNARPARDLIARSGDHKTQRTGPLRGRRPENGTAFGISIGIVTFVRGVPGSEDRMPRIGARLIGVSLLFGLTAPCASAAEYSLIPNPQTVHVGYFSAALKPC